MEDAQCFETWKLISESSQRTEAVRSYSGWRERILEKYRGKGAGKNSEGHSVDSHFMFETFRKLYISENFKETFKEDCTNSMCRMERKAEKLSRLSLGIRGHRFQNIRVHQNLVSDVIWTERKRS